MPHENLTVSSLYINMITGFLHSQHFNVPFSHSTISDSPCISTRLPLKVLLDFIEGIVSETHMHSIGLDIGSQVHLSDYGVMGHAVMSVATLKEAIEFINKYKHLLIEGINSELLTTPETITIKLESVFNHQSLIPLIELEFASLIRLGKIISGPINCHKVQAKEVHFSHGPQTCNKKYAEVFKCPVKFNKIENAIIIERAVLSTPIYTPDPSLFIMIMQRIETASANMPSPLHLRVFDHIFTVMMNSIVSAMPKAEDTARHFNMSISALKKHLKQENTHYTIICDEVRKKIAIHLIRQKELKLKAIYHQLGFSSASAFNRAFRRWMGASPSQYKANLD